jgi:hypothetical protein
MIDVYALASGLIGSDEIQLKKFIGNTENTVGQEIPSYDDPILIEGQFQAIEATLYARLGLDLTKAYRTLYTAESIKMLDDSSSDRIIYNNEEYQAIKKLDWSLNGYKGVLCVRL